MYFLDDFLSSHIGKPYDISREDLLVDRTSLVHVYLMFVLYRTKGLKYTFFLFVCVHVCLCMYFVLYCNAYLFHIIFIDSKSSYELSTSCSQNIYDTFTYTVL